MKLKLSIIGGDDGFLPGDSVQYEISLPIEHVNIIDYRQRSLRTRLTAV
jgi:hypothetical protein